MCILDYKNSSGDELIQKGDSVADLKFRTFWELLLLKFY